MKMFNFYLCNAFCCTSWVTVVNWVSLRIGKRYNFFVQILESLSVFYVFTKL